MLVRVASGLKESGPGGLGIIEHERDELHLLLLLRAARHGACRARLARRPTVRAQQGEEVLLEDQTEHEQDGRASQPNAHAPAAKPTTAPPAVLQIAAAPTRCPPHEASLV